MAKSSGARVGSYGNTKLKVKVSGCPPSDLCHLSGKSFPRERIHARTHAREEGCIGIDSPDWNNWSNDKKEWSHGGYLYATKACTAGRAPGLSPGPPVMRTMGTGQRRSDFRTFGIRSGICSRREPTPNMSACLQGRVSACLFLSNNLLYKDYSQPKRTNIATITLFSLYCHLRVLFFYCVISLFSTYTSSSRLISKVLLLFLSYPTGVISRNVIESTSLFVAEGGRVRL